MSFEKIMCKSFSSRWAEGDYHVFEDVELTAPYATILKQKSVDRVILDLENMRAMLYKEIHKNPYVLDLQLIVR